ncbi:MAG: LysR family transcriptional regulator [Bifidobacterium dentium]
MNTPADSNTRENANTNTDISITANATGFSTKTLNPQILVTLWNVERLGSFSAVARETGWSQPAISQQIRKVERELDAKLVQRTSHGVELTRSAVFWHATGSSSTIASPKPSKMWKSTSATDRRIFVWSLPHRYVRRSWHACSCISAKRPTFA